PLVGSAGGVGFDLVCRTVLDVNTAAIGLPAGNAGREMFIGVCNAAVVFFFELVFNRVRSGVPPLPEGFNKLVALFVIGELFKSGTLFISDDPAHIFVEPLAIGLAYLDLQR